MQPKPDQTPDVDPAAPLQRTRGWRLVFWCVLDMALIMIIYEIFEHFARRAWAPYSPYVITAVFVVFAGLVAALFMNRVILRREADEQARLDARRRLDAAQAEIRKLSNLLPMCANCKKIRDEFGRWHEVETYISSHTQTKFTHGVCEECARKLYPGIMLQSRPPGTTGEPV
jgi:hypothetical protein